MKTINLLDCTLRDGGYINNWNFGNKTIRNIIQKLIDSQVEFVELGFLRNCQYDPDKVLFNNMKELQPILPENCENTAFSLMCLHNLYDIDKLEPYDGQGVEIIRVTFHDYDIDEGLAFIEKVIAKGYKCFCNPINIMGYSDQEVLSLIDKVNRIKPYAFTIVDTFGSMMKTDLIRLYSLVEHNLDPSIHVGLHLHENLSLSYSLAQDFLGIRSGGRKCVIDASLFGMGRAPGNLCLELIMNYMNRYQDCSYDVNAVLDAIEDYIVPLKEIEPWGYNIAYALSAKYNMHRNYGEYLLRKGKLRTKHINQILANTAEEKKTAYDEEYIEGLYREYQSIKVEDTETRTELRETLRERNILILAPGPTLRTQQEGIQAYISEENPLIISANFDGGDFAPDIKFYTNTRRYEDYLTQGGQKAHCVVTSNLLHTESVPDRVINYSDLFIDDKGNSDNCVIMLLRLLSELGIKKTAIAGFDGYDLSVTDNYYDKNMATPVRREDLEHTNEEIRKALVAIRKSMKGKDLRIHFITDSQYADIFERIDHV